MKNALSAAGGKAPPTRPAAEGPGFDEAWRGLCEGVLASALEANRLPAAGPDSALAESLTKRTLPRRGELTTAAGVFPALLWWRNGVVRTRQERDALPSSRRSAAGVLELHYRVHFPDAPARDAAPAGLHPSGLVSAWAKGAGWTLAEVRSFGPMWRGKVNLAAAGFWGVAEAALLLEDVPAPCPERMAAELACHRGEIGWELLADWADDHPAAFGPRAAEHADALRGWAAGRRAKK